MSKSIFDEHFAEKKSDHRVFIILNLFCKCISNEWKLWSTLEYIDAYRFKHFKGMFVYDLARIRKFHWNLFRMFSIGYDQGKCMLSLLAIHFKHANNLHFIRTHVRFNLDNIINVKHKCLQSMCVALTHSRSECQSIIICMTCFFAVHHSADYK